jgi:hypothetical protein
MPPGRFITSRPEAETSEVENMDSDTSKAPSTENIPLETSRSEFPSVFSRTVSGPSSYTGRWTNERIKQRLKLQEALD